MTVWALRVIGWVPVREACGERRVSGEVFRGGEGGIEVDWGGGISSLPFSLSLILLFISSTSCFILSFCLLLFGFACAVAKMLCWSRLSQGMSR